MKDLKQNMPPLEDAVMTKDDADRWIEGKIIDSKGNPVMGAHIYLGGGGYQDIKETFTDPQGHYRLDGLKNETEVVYQIHKNYGSYYFQSLPTNEIHNFTFEIPSYHLSGRVVDSNDNPVVNARVSIVPQKRESGFIYIGSNTDINGYFRIDNMIDEEVNISIGYMEIGHMEVENVKTNRDGIIFILK